MEMKLRITRKRAHGLIFKNSSKARQSTHNGSPEGPSKTDIYNLLEQSHCFMFLQRGKNPVMRIYETSDQYCGEMVLGQILIKMLELSEHFPGEDLPHNLEKCKLKLLSKITKEILNVQFVFLYIFFAVSVLI